jgi:hypothetical protein
MLRAIAGDAEVEDDDAVEAVRPRSRSCSRKELKPAPTCGTAVPW